jgi:hypothetical protein
VPDLGFEVLGASSATYAAAPTLNIQLQISNSGPEELHSILLRCQIQIEVTRRRYGDAEQSKLFDLFGPPSEWDRSLRNLLWTRSDLSVPGFTGRTIVDLPLPCTYDFNVAGVKYFAALESGEIPLCLLFSGTVFYAADHGGWQVMQIPWEMEATFRLPVRVWREMMERYYPNCAWLCLHKDVFERLFEYKSRHVLPTWEKVFENLLAPAPGLLRAE